MSKTTRTPGSQSQTDPSPPNRGAWFRHDHDLLGGWAISKDLLIHENRDKASAGIAPRQVDVGDGIPDSDEGTSAAAALTGTLLIGVSAGELAADMSVPASSTWTMTLEDPPDTGWLFANNDTCVIRRGKTGADETWFSVQRAAQSGGLQTYTCTFKSGKRPAIFHTGNLVIDYGKSGQGFLVMSARLSGAPFYSVRTHAGAPWATTTERARLGNMNGAFGVTSDVYGMGIGDYAGQKYIRFDGSTVIMAVDSLGVGNNSPDARLNVGDGTRTGFAPISEMLAVRQDVSSGDDHLAAVILQNWEGTTGKSIQGLESYLTANHASGTLNLVLNLISNTEHRGAGAISTVRLFSGAFLIDDHTGNVSNVFTFATAPVKRGATAVGTINNYFGLYLDAQPSVGITNRYGVYQLGSGEKNYFNGNVGLGTNNPGSALTFADARDVALGVVTGTKFGTAPSQKLSLWGKPPIVQPADVGMNNGTLSSVAAQGNAIRALLRTIGLTG